MKKKSALQFVIAIIIIFCFCRCHPFYVTPLSTWAGLSDFNGGGRTEAVSFVIGNYAYVALGFSPQNNIRLKDCWQFDTTSKSWTQKADFGGTARSSAISFTINNEGYVGTGFDGNIALSDFWQYDPVSNQWAEKVNFPGNSRYDAVGFNIEGYGYIATGTDGVNTMKDIWQYDPASNSWVQKADLPGTPRSAAVVFEHVSYAYLVTGVNKDTAVTDFWKFDPSQPDSGTWFSLRSIANVTSQSYDDRYATIKRWNAVGFVVTGNQHGDMGYLTTGGTSSLNTTAWFYDFTTDLWQQDTPFGGSPRNGAVGFSLQNIGFVGLGGNSTGLSDMWELQLQ